jgi:cyclophilin family peptidyl-prolyl cis-trans isomerase
MKKSSIVCLLAGLLLTACSSEPKKETIVVIETSMGTLKAKLYNSTPKHKANFLKLVKEGYYDGLLFHRVIRNFMMQGGDPLSKNAPSGLMLGAGGPDYKIPAEIGRYHFKGALAAARLGNQANPNKESSGSQFYIVQGQPVAKGQLEMMTKGKNIKYTAEDIQRYETAGGAPFLDGDYTVFGEVIEGMEIIDMICSMDVDQNSRPLKDITMKITIQN